MAPRRSVPDDRRQEALALAGGRPGWGCARRSGPEPARQEGRQASAKRLLRKLLKRQTRVPRVMITDKLASYSAAKADVMPSVEHRRHKGLYGDIDVKVRVQRQRSSGFVGRDDGYELI